ncbi:MAG: ATP-binding protein [Kiritimatiellae bacterium]|nr:ATP-binding protein [Kiritimatiellia bacterium]
MLKMTLREKTKRILLATILAAATPAFAVGADAMASLRPKAVEHVGDFCHTGTVTMVCQNLDFSLAERNGRHHFLVVRKQFGIRVGEIIVAAGECVRCDNGSVLKIARRVLHLGQELLPSPEKVSIAELTKKDFLYKMVTTEGTLVLARRDEIDTAYIQMLVKDGASIVNAAFMASTNRTIDAISLLGARVRLTGVLMQGYGARRNISNYLSLDPPGGFEVVTPPPADTFKVPELNLDSQYTPEEIVQMDPRRFNGVVMATWGGNQLMLAGKGSRCVRATLARDGELPVAGDYVAVVGFPDTDLYGINLVYAQCRPLADGKDFGFDPKPVEVTLRQLLTDGHGRPRINGYSHGRLLRLRGTVLDVQPSLALFSINDDGLTLPVDCSSSPNVIPRLEANSRIEVVALAITETDSWRECIALPQTRGLRLVLRSASDLEVLAFPPWWTPARLTATVISLLVIIVLIIAANRIINRIMMRRKVSERTRLAVELHDSLSQTLAGVACQISAGHDAIDDDPKSAKELLGTAERMLESSRTELKNCLFDLRNDTVDDPDFTRAISKTLTGFRTEANISIRFNVARSLLTDSTAHAILCIVRELVANAVRHGAATRIRIAGVAADKRLRFSVHDNGRGFDTERRPGPREGHFGLASIRERLADIKGSFKITSRAGDTRATVNMTLP